MEEDEESHRVEGSPILRDLALRRLRKMVMENLGALGDAEGFVLLRNLGHSSANSSDIPTISSQLVIVIHRGLVVPFYVTLPPLCLRFGFRWFISADENVCIGGIGQLPPKS